MAKNKRKRSKKFIGNLKIPEKINNLKEFDEFVSGFIKLINNALSEIEKEEINNRKMKSKSKEVNQIKPLTQGLNEVYWDEFFNEVNDESNQDEQNRDETE